MWRSGISRSLVNKYGAGSEDFGQKLASGGNRTREEDEVTALPTPNPLQYSIKNNLICTDLSSRHLCKRARWQILFHERKAAKEYFYILIHIICTEYYQMMVFLCNVSAES